MLWMLFSLLLIVVLICLGAFWRLDCDITLATKRARPGFFKGKVVWITGASSGIGEALAHAFAADGATVVLSSRRKEQLERVQQSMPDGKSEIVVLDLEDFNTHAEKVQSVLSRVGPVDVLVNNGGISSRETCLELEFDADVMLMNVNYLGQVSLTKAVLPHMVKRRSGCLINISSVMGKGVGPSRTAYCAPKHALLGFMNALRVEMDMAQSGVQITNICPGPVATNVARNAVVKGRNKFGGEDKIIDEGMRAERCAQLILRAASNGLHEALVSTQPILFVTYLWGFLPRIAHYLVVKNGHKAQGIKKKD